MRNEGLSRHDLGREKFLEKVNHHYFAFHILLLFKTVVLNSLLGLGLEETVRSINLWPDAEVRLLCGLGQRRLHHGSQDEQGRHRGLRQTS